MLSESCFINLFNQQFSPELYPMHTAIEQLNGFVVTCFFHACSILEIFFTELSSKLDVAHFSLGDFTTSISVSSHCIRCFDMALVFRWDINFFFKCTYIYS